MDTTGWRERLAEALKASGKSKRAVSLESGNGAGYLHSILNEGKDPSIDNLSKICQTMGVSLTRVLYGFDVTRETEELMRAAEESPELRAHLLAILAARREGRRKSETSPQG